MSDDDSAFCTITDTIELKVENAIRASGRRKVFVYYSAYPTDKDDNPIDNLDKIAIQGKAILLAARDDFYGGKRSKNYRSPVVENPTWLQIAVLANDMIRTVRDSHHCFLENVEKLAMTSRETLAFLKSFGEHFHDEIREAVSRDPDLQLYEFVMGS